MTTLKQLKEKILYLLTNKKYISVLELYVVLNKGFITL